MESTLTFLISRYHLLYSIYDSDKQSDFFKVKDKQLVRTVHILEDTLVILENLNPVHSFLIREFYKNKRSLSECVEEARTLFSQYNDYSFQWYKKQKKFALKKFIFLLKQHEEIDDIIAFGENFKKTLKEEGFTYGNRR